MYHHIKYLLDFISSILASITLFPLIIICAVVIKLDSRGPLIFVQKRAGKDGRIFSLYKFRTMTHKKRENKSEVFSDNSEVTKVGRILRRYKIDELPQLLNVIRGDLSLVGPRPCLPEQIKDFDANGNFRLKVKPGLTGLAQINGNIYLTWQERWKYDRYYVENMSFILDIKIIIKTFLLLIIGEDKLIKKPNA